MLQAIPGAKTEPKERTVGIKKGFNMSYLQNQREIWNPKPVVEKRKELKLDRLDVARELGIQENSYQRHESGSSVPSLIAVAKMSKYYGIPIDEMVDLSRVEINNPISHTLEEKKKKLYRRDDIALDNIAIESEYPYNLLEVMYGYKNNPILVTSGEKKQIESLIEVLPQDAQEYIMGFFDPYGTIVSQIPKEELENILSNNIVDRLQERERVVLHNRYVRMKTLKETSEIIGGISRERVRQIEKKAIGKIRGVTHRNILERLRS